MKKLLISFFVVFSAVSYAEGEYTSYDKDAGIRGCFNSNGTPLFGGTVRETTENGFREIPCKNGKAEGIVKYYYKSGKLQGEAPNKNGKVEGLVKKYYESGALESEGLFKNGKLEGFAKLYYESGILQNEDFYKDGKLEGVSKWYYESGKLKREISLKNGIREGTHVMYRENGKLFITIIDSNNKAVSGVCHMTNGINMPLTNAEILNWNNGLRVECP